MAILVAATLPRLAGAESEPDPARACEPDCPREIGDPAEQDTPGTDVEEDVVSPAAPPSDDPAGGEAPASSEPEITDPGETDSPGENENPQPPGEEEVLPGKPNKPGPEKPGKPGPDKPGPDKPGPDKPERPGKKNPGPGMNGGATPPVEIPVSNGGVSPDEQEQEESGAGFYDSSAASISSFGGGTSGLWSPERILEASSIEDFDIPPFLLPVFQACGARYDVPWSVLASINRIETDFGRLNEVTSYAGAQGWMQFMPATWDAYGTDANRDGRADPYNPVDAICSAARYLKAAGAPDDMYSAIWAYNHADWYVEDVLAGARTYSALPADLVFSISNLASASHSPAGIRAKYRPSGGRLPGLSFQSNLAFAPTDSVVIEAKKADEEKKAPGKGESGKKKTQEMKGKPAKSRAHKQADSGDTLLLRDRAGNIYRFSGLKLSAKIRKARDGQAIRSGQLLGRSRSGFDFSLRPAGPGSPWIDPTAFVEGWNILEAAGYSRLPVKIRQQGRGLAALLAMSDSRLRRIVLSDPRLQIYECGRGDIASGFTDSRVLVLLVWLADQGYDLSISSLTCGHSYLSASGNVSNHSYGSGVDIAAINGVSVYGNQQPGSLTEEVVLKIMGLGGVMRPDELISLFDFGPPSWAQGDHDDHIHVGYSGGSSGEEAEPVIGPRQWKQITEQLQGNLRP